MKIPRGQAAEAFWRRFNLFRALAWLALSVAAVALDWISSVRFVSAASLYANIASDGAAWRADSNPQLDEVLERLDRIERLLNGAAA